MITAEELYFLNETIDSKEIYGLNSEKFWKKLENQKKNLIRSMITKNILTSTANINLNTIFIIDALKKYKKAEKYVWINGEITSIDDTLECVCIKLNEKNEIILKQALKSSVVIYILKSFSFLSDDFEKYKNTKKAHMSLEEFLNSGILNFPKEKVLYLRKCIREKIVQYKIYFVSNKRLYRYDALEQSLENISSRCARIEIAEFYEI